MTAPTALPAPLLTVPATGLGLARTGPAVATLVLHNAAVHTTAQLTRDELLGLAEQFTAVAETLTEAGPQLVTPAGAGRLIVPGAEQ